MLEVDFDEARFLCDAEIFNSVAVVVVAVVVVVADVVVVVVAAEVVVVGLSVGPQEVV